jgi:hypothetical protein
MTATLTERTTPRRGASARVNVPVGAPPRVSLMPPELGERNRQLSVQRSLRAVMVLVLVLVLAAIGGAWYLSISAGLALTAETDRTASLQTEKISHQ